MNILVLHGPNMNLIGVRSSRVGERVTLGKIDTALRRKSRALDVTLKILQTHYPGKAITFLQRNRNWADGLIFSPGPWAKSQFDLLDTVKLVSIPSIEVHLPPEFTPDRYSDDSIFRDVVLSTKLDGPVDVYTEALTELHRHLSSKQR